MSTPEDKIPQEDPLERQKRIMDAINETIAAGDFVPGIAGVIPEDRGLGFFRSAGRLIGGVGESVAAGINRIAGGGLSRDIKGAFAGDVQAKGRLVAQEGLFLLEGINQGLLQPAANVTEFFAEVAEVVGLDEIEAGIREQADLIRSTIEGSISQAEGIALQVGFDERTVAKIRIGGGLAGFIAPLGASFKVASSITGLRGVRLGQNITHDFVAGNILGLFNTEGDLINRGKHAVVEGSLFGAFALVGAMFPWFGSFRRKRRATTEVFSDDVIAEARAKIAEGRALITKDKERATFELMAEEDIIAQSPIAQQILIKNADIDAVIAGLRDVASDRTGHFIVRGVADKGVFTARMAELFPGVKISPHRAKNGTNMVLSFGGKGLNNAQRAQMSKQGFFDGLRVSHGGIEAEIAGLSGRAGFVKLRPLGGGKIKQVKLENVSFHASARSIEIVPGNDGLFREFSRWFNDRLNTIAKTASQGISRERLIDDVAKGRFALDELKLRDTVGDVIITPLDAGMDATQRIVFDVGTKPGVRLSVKPVSPAELQISPEQAKGKAFLQIFRGEEAANAMLEVSQTSRGLLVTGLDGASLASIPRRTAKLLGERIAEVIPNVERIEMLGVREPVFETIKANVARGANDFFVVPPQTLGSFDDVVGVWMKEQGIAGADAQIFREFAAQRMRRELFESLPATEKALITNLRDQYAEILNQGRLDLEFLATTHGFKFERGAEGSAKLIDATTGAEFFFTSEAGVREALKVARTQRDLIESTLIPADFAAIAPPHSPNLAPTGEIPSIVAISDESIAKGYLASIPEAKLLTPLADVAKKFERDTQFPLFTGYVDDVLNGVKQMRNSLSLDYPNIERNWMRLGRKRVGQMSRIRVVDFWESLGGRHLEPDKLQIAAKAFGLSSKEITIMNRARDIFDVGAVRAGIPPGEFVEQYFGRIRPRVQAGTDATRTAIYGNEPVPPAADAFFTHVRRGHMDPIEKDPLIVQLAWFRAEAQTKFVSKPFDKLAQLTGFGRARIPAMRMRDLPPGQQASLKKVFDETGIVFDLDSSVLPQEIADIYNTMLVNLQGGQHQQAGALTKIFSGMYKLMGVDVTDAALRQFFNNMLSSTFGALVGSAKAVARNATAQINFMDYVRYGGKHMGRAIEFANTQEGWNKAFADNVFSLREGGVAGGDVLFERFVTPGIGGSVEARNAFGTFVAPFVRLQLKTANFTAKLAQKILIPFSSTDDINRARSYYNTRFNVEDEILAFKAGKITEQEFKDFSMKGFTPEMKEEFFRRFKVSDERGLQYSGRQVADENHFLYGLATQPLYLQTTVGKLAGMFSSWPLNAKEFYTFRFMNLTAKQKAESIARTSIATAALGITGSTLGYNLWGWVSPFAIFNYSGGPFVDVGQNLRNVIDAPFNQKVGAIQRVARELGRMAVPGQQAGRDVARALADTNDPTDMVLSLILGRQTDRGIEVDFSHILDEKDKADSLALLEGRPISPALSQPLRGITGLPQMSLSPQVGRPTAPSHEVQP